MKHIIAGLILAGLGVWGIVTWWNVFGLVMRGVVPFTLLVLGLIGIIAGCRRNSDAEQSCSTTGRSGEKPGQGLKTAA